MKKYRDAGTGHYVTKEYAKANPGTTVSEQDFDLEKALKAISERVTDEQKEEQERFQQEMRAGLGSRLDPNSPEQRILRARQQEMDLLRTISRLVSAPESDLKQQRLYQSLNRLSELLAEQGKYSEAISVCPNQAKKEEYRRISSAVAKESCDCPPEKLKDGTEQAAQIQIGTIIHDGKALTLRLCRTCNFLHAK